MTFFNPVSESFKNVVRSMTLKSVTTSGTFLVTSYPLSAKYPPGTISLPARYPVRPDGRDGPPGGPQHQGGGLQHWSESHPVAGASLRPVEPPHRLHLHLQRLCQRQLYLKLPGRVLHPGPNATTPSLPLSGGQPHHKLVSKFVLSR